MFTVHRCILRRTKPFTINVQISALNNKRHHCELITQIDSQCELVGQPAGIKTLYLASRVFAISPEKPYTASCCYKSGP